mmetsp:Transcript_32339/g.54809  ORF Transcript_32339/g.54809 Transcript_32339/m.54809 type:complete len:358 (-) Transcript_32339:122-1195(-)
MQRVGQHAFHHPLQTHRIVTTNRPRRKFQTGMKLVLLAVVLCACTLIALSLRPTTSLSSRVGTYRATTGRGGLLTPNFGSSSLFARSISKSNILKRGADVVRMGADVAEKEGMARADAQSVNFDLRLLEDSPEVVLMHLKARRAKEDMIEAVTTIGNLNERRRMLIKERDSALSQRKTLSQQIGQLMRNGEEDKVADIKAQVEKANAAAAEAEEDLDEVLQQCNALFSRLPNLLDERVPDGDSDEENQLVLQWGDEFKRGDDTDDDGMKWHDELATNLGGYAPEAAVKVSGARFSVLKGPLASLERALSAFMLNMHTMEHGYEEHSVPYIVSRQTLEGTGQLPKFEDDLFQTNHDVG